MAIRFYDDALYEKIQKWIKDPNMVILKPNETTRLFQIREDQTNDKPLTLPLITIARDPTVNISVTGKRNLTFDGAILDSNEKSSIQLEAIPIDLNYQLDIYTRKYDEGDEYLRNFIFNLINHPTMSILLPYNDAQIEHICYIRLLSNVADNSDISEKLFPDEFTRWTIQLSISDAYLFSIPINNNAKIVDGALIIKDHEFKTEEKEIIPK